MKKTAKTSFKPLFKLFYVLCLVGSVLVSFKPALASYCWVINESDNNSTQWSFRWTIEEVFNSYSNPYCDPPTDSPGDTDYFDQVILFGTEGFGVSAEDAVKEITLGSSSRKNDAINFDNFSHTLVIGNWSEENVTDEESEINYSSSYSSMITHNYGTVIIDGQKYFDEVEAPITCSTGTSSVYFRNVIFLTNGVTQEDLPSCIHNAGAFYVCPGEFNGGVAPGDSGWCDWEEDEEEETDPNDQDGDGYLTESVGGDDCDDTSASVYPGATESPEDGIDQDCDGIDGACLISASLSSATIYAGESYEFSINFEYVGGYDKESNLIITGMDSTMSSDAGFVLEENETNTTTITTAENTTEGTYSLTFKGRSGSLTILNRQIVYPLPIHKMSFSLSQKPSTQSMTRSIVQSIPIENKAVSYARPLSFFYSCETQVNLTVLSVPEEENTEDDCSDDYDNDGDTYIDCMDSDCSSDEACQEIEIPDEDCSNGMDDDGDGNVDCDDSECLNDSLCLEEDSEDEDLDGDGYFTDTDEDGNCNGTSNCDCDDGDAEIHPGATEICDDEMDNDCDGYSINEDDLVDDGLLSCQVVEKPPSSGANSGCSCHLTTTPPPPYLSFTFFGLGFLAIIFLRMRLSCQTK